MIVCDLDEQFAEILQVAPSKLRGSNIYDLTHPDDLPSNRRLLDGLRNEGRTFSITKRYLRSDGEIVWVNNHVSRFSGNNDNMRLLATVQPIDRKSDPKVSDLASVAKKILEVRQSRLQIFEDHIFGEPDYEVLLDLYVNEQEGRPVSVSSACIAAGVPSTTGLRHIARLASAGWIERVADAHDKRRTNLALTSKAYIRVSRYLSECERARRSY